MYFVFMKAWMFAHFHDTFSRGKFANGFPLAKVMNWPESTDVQDIKI